MDFEKIYVEVIVRFLAEGGMRPIYIIWNDGRKFEIDKVRYIERAPARVSSVLPMRYTCSVGGKDKYLYYESAEERWFIEKERV